MAKHAYGTLSMDDEYKLLTEIEKMHGERMSTGEAAKYCGERFGVPCSESTLVNGRRVVNGLVSKSGVREYVSWYKTKNPDAFEEKYPFMFFDENGEVHKHGYSPK